MVNFPRSQTTRTKASLAALLTVLLATLITVPNSIEHSSSAWSANKTVSVEVTTGTIEPPRHIYTWGASIFSTQQVLTPTYVDIPESLYPKQISAGSNHSLFTTADGSVYAVGVNTTGELGDGSNTHTYIPTKALLPEDTVATTVSGGAALSLASDTDGKVWAWGNNSFGQLGIGANAVTKTNSPLQSLFPAAVNIVSVSAGSNHALALDSDGQVWAWGSDASKQTSIGTTSTPTVVPLPFTIVEISAGHSHSLALTETGEVIMWGSIFVKSYSTPTNLSLPVGKEVISISAGYQNTLVVTSDGEAWGEGRNVLGQLGTGDTSPVTSFVRTLTPEDVTIESISVGLEHSLALDSDGQVWAWGSNTKGALGIGQNGGVYGTPTQPIFPSEMKTITVSAGTNYSLSLGDRDGSESEQEINTERPPQTEMTTSVTSGKRNGETILLTDPLTTETYRDVQSLKEPSRTKESDEPSLIVMPSNSSDTQPALNP